MKASEFSLSESFDSDVQGKLIRATNNSFTTRAVIGNRIITFNASSYEENNITPATVWEIEFTEKTADKGISYGKTGSGNEMQVFSFVIESVKELVSRYHPDILEFSSHKSDGNRTSLYRRLINRVKLPGYSIDNVDSDKYSDTFRIIKDTI